MKVLCISEPKNKVTNGFSSIIKEGEIYTVIDEGWADNEKDSYEIAEHVGFWYAKELFIPVSEIDEKEFVRNYQTQTA